ncbi:MAG: DUF4349 domain-containing protein [bacterium]|nr:DUF4349 domain-containing protein [bacterium]
MNNKICLIMIPVFVMISLSISCSKEQDASAPMASKAKMETAVMEEFSDEGVTDNRKEAKKRAAPGKPKNQNQERELDSNFIKSMEAAQGRMLEYTVNLVYKSDTFLHSRQTLLDIVGKYGFIASAGSSTEGKFPKLRTTFHIRSEDLYRALKELDAAGTLLNESISVFDHTENMEQNRRKIEREALRLIRKNRAIGQVAPGKKTWTQRESSLERSEDSLDRSKHEDWKIKDRVSWAKITLNLKGPDYPEKAEVKVPVFKKAFIGLLNLLLEIVYWTIWIMPFIALFLTIWLKREAIKNFFSKKKE